MIRIAHIIGTRIKALLIILILISVISLFIYETFYMVQTSVSLTISHDHIHSDSLLKEALINILQDPVTRDSIFKALLLHHSCELSHIPLCEPYLIYLKYLLSFLDMDPLQYKIGIRFSTDYESLNYLMLQCITESNKLLVEVIFRRILYINLLVYFYNYIYLILTNHDGPY